MIYSSGSCLIPVRRHNRGSRLVAVMSYTIPLETSRSVVDRLPDAEWTRSGADEGGHGLVGASSGVCRDNVAEVRRSADQYPPAGNLKAAGSSHITVRPSPSHGRGPATEGGGGGRRGGGSSAQHPDPRPDRRTAGAVSAPRSLTPTRFMEEIPSLLWGLDPVFLAFAKLYIRDILELKESHQVPGIFFYNGHPIRQVDIVGTVVCVREKEAFYSYGVDDSTGVINCTCWKSSGPKCVSSSENRKGSSNAKNLEGLMQELYSQESRKAKMEIGDVIRVRGYIKVFRNQREVVASTFYKVDDPTLDVQITRMLDLPHLYRNVYDKPFIIPDHLQDPSHGLSHDAVLSRSGLILQLSEKIKEFLEENRIGNFYQQELESVPSLLSTATVPRHNTEAGECSSITSKEIHNLFEEAIKLLQKKGIVYVKGHKTGVYQVTDQDKELHKLALSIIQEDCRRQRHADKGCHFLHILNCVQQTFGWSVNDTVLQRVMEALERNSEIVSTMERYYTSF